VGLSKKKKEVERIFNEMMDESFPDLKKDMNISIQEAQQTPTKMNSKRPTLRHIIIRLSKAKEKGQTLEAAREKTIVTNK